MEQPYVYFENVLDAEGNQRQFRTTKLKYTDDTGRLCLLGICEDISEKIRMERENESAREAYEKSLSASLVFTRLANTLARNYTNLYYVNLETEEYTEYMIDGESGSLNKSKNGSHFFENCKKLSAEHIYPKDREAFEQAMKKETLLEMLDKDKTFIVTLRRITSEGPKYVSMKVTRMEDDKRFMIIGISDADEQTRRQKEIERLAEEQIAYERLKALVGEFLCIFVVIPETGNYRQFSSTSGFDSLELAKEGTDFFNITRELSLDIVYPEDLDRFLSLFTEEGVLSEIERSGIFSLTYRIMLNGKPTYIQLKAAMTEEKEGRRIIVGLNDIDSHIRQEKEYANRLEQAQIKASVAALTGVRNRHSYLEAEDQLNRLIADRTQPGFAITVFDVNDLKSVNDNEGHHAGDMCLCSACKIISDIFKHSQVFRVGGDEFAVISQNDDYDRIEELIEKVKSHNASAIRTGGIVIACGTAKYENDSFVASVFERADRQMYENKDHLKTLTHPET